MVPCCISGDMLRRSALDIPGINILSSSVGVEAYHFSDSDGSFFYCSVADVHSILTEICECAVLNSQQKYVSCMRASLKTLHLSNTMLKALFNTLYLKLQDASLASA